MEQSLLKSKIEALLFIYGEPIEVKKLAKILDLKESEVKSGLEMLAADLKREDRGLTLLEDKSRFQLATKPEFSKFLEEITKQEFTEVLTPASLETLSIISYAGPISRADIEYIRGVNSSFTVRALLMRGLVERSIDPKMANAYLYSTSFELLRHQGLSKNGDLPEYERFKSLISNLHEELKNKDQKQMEGAATEPVNAEPNSNLINE